MNDMPFWSAHTHTAFSAKDALPSPKSVIDRAVELNYPAIGFTDHGTMGGIAQGYKAASKAGIGFLPGVEAYIAIDRMVSRPATMHLGMLATTEKGYRNLVALNNTAQRNFKYKPVLDLADLAQAAEDGRTEGIAVMTGCWFGLAATLLRGQAPQAVRNIIAALDSWFGSGCYVEVQNHLIVDREHDDWKHSALLTSIAEQMGLPMVITQDSHYCSVPSAPIWMGDLTFKPIGEVVVGDEVMGWTRVEGRKYKVMTKTTVTAVNKRIAPVVKITTSSGKVVRVTADHRWAKARNWRYGTGPEYGPVKVGDKMVRLIDMPSELPTEHLREAGWLAGMYDGEGSRQGIAQSPRWNPLTTERLRKALDLFNYDYQIQDNGAGCHVYRIRGGKPEYVRFINQIQPSKTAWFEGRIVDRKAYAEGYDTVIAIEPDGLSEVISLTTETHNYVVYGYASSNCHLEDRPAHETMKRLVSWSDDPDDAVFPGDGYHMVDTEWMEEHHTINTFNAGMAGLEDLLSKAKVKIRELDTFKAAIPDVTPGKDPDDMLREQVTKALAARIADGQIPKSKDKVYAERIERELDVVCGAGFAGYLLFTAKVCRWIRDQGIAYNIRGSASGSMLCWLLDITRLDPITWKLPFERFLSNDRTSMPDIDIDVEDARRDEVLEMLDSQYTTYRIGTWLELGLNAEDDSKGSLIIKWKQKTRRTGGDVDAGIPEKEMNELRALASHSPYSGQGVHAAGVVVAPDEASLTGLPLTWIASSKQLVSAFPMKDVESMGLVKLDVLGLKTLTALREMQDLTGIEPFSVPLDDKGVFKMIAKGEVDGIFQLEGSAAARGIRDVKVTKMADIIASVALFRPAILKSGATRAYTDRKAGREPITERHPIIMAETKDTVGVLLYQEQAMDILRNFGLPIEYIEKARKAIKASNANVGDAAKVMAEVIAKVKENATDLSEDDAEWLEDVLAAYAGYSFNRAHATAYGQVAYITAWFKLHHPVAFWTAQLNAYIGDDQETSYLRAARKQGVSIRPPHVNRSEAIYTADFKSNAIRKGLTSIKGVGPKAAIELAEKAPFTSLADLASRVNARAVTGAAALRKQHTPEACGGVIAHLAEANALLDLPSTEQETAA